jgi:hypothetical protein
MEILQWKTKELENKGYEQCYQVLNTKSGKFKKTKKERMEERKKKDYYVHNCVFSISRECPQVTTLLRPSLKRTHSYENLPYKKRKFEYKG